MPLDNPQGYRQDYRQQLRSQGLRGDPLREQLRGLMKQTRVANRMAERNANRPGAQNQNWGRLWDMAGNRAQQRNTKGPAQYSNFASQGQDLQSLIAQFLKSIFGM